MRAFIITSGQYPHIGGKSTHISDLAEGLRELQVAVTIFSMDSIPTWLTTLVKAGFAPVWLVSRGCFIYHYRSVLGWLLKAMVRRENKRGNADFLIFEDADSAVFFADYVKRSGVVSALTMHTYFGLELKLDNNPNYQDDRYYQKTLQRELKSLEVVRGVVGVDARIRDHVADSARSMAGCRIVDDCIVSIKNFTNIHTFAPVPHAPSDKIQILCVRRLVEKNGVLFLVRAMAELRAESVELKILGDGPESPRISECVRQNHLESVVTLVGPVQNSEVLPYYHQADIAVIPSITVNGLQEATSISAIEAMACGLPTIASRIGGLKELIEDHETGILVEEQDALELACRIRELCHDAALRARIGNNAREYVVRHHSHMKAAEEYLQFLHRLRQE